MISILYENERKETRIYLGQKIPDRVHVFDLIIDGDELDFAISHGLTNERGRVVRLSHGRAKQFAQHWNQYL